MEPSLLRSTMMQAMPRLFLSAAQQYVLFRADAKHSTKGGISWDSEGRGSQCVPSAKDIRKKVHKKDRRKTGEKKRAPKVVVLCRLACSGGAKTAKEAKSTGQGGAKAPRAVSLLRGSCCHMAKGGFTASPSHHPDHRGLWNVYLM